MADKISISKSLSIGVEYAEGRETRTTTINIPNFRTGLTEQQIKNAFTGNNVIIYGYDDQETPLPVLPENVVTASTTNQTVHNIDIGWE